jgi:excisionase family DNA binding protein
MKLLTTAEVADLIGFTPATVQDWVQQGKLTCGRKVGGRYRFWECEVLAELGLEPPSQPPREVP